MDHPTIWLVIGFAGQALFSARFIVQWIASERVRKSVVPVTFWFFSLAGGAMLFIYAYSRHDPVIMLGQASGLVVYVRNLWLIYKHRETETDSVPVAQ